MHQWISYAQNVDKILKWCVYLKVKIISITNLWHYINYKFISLILKCLVLFAGGCMSMNLLFLYHFINNLIVASKVSDPT